MKDIKDFKNKYGLSGLHSKPTSYMKFEDKTEEVFKDVELLIHKTREETIREVEERLSKIIKYNSEIEEDYKYAYGNLVDEINKLKK